MRILHTSDWHLGQHFIGHSRAVEHRAFFQWLISQVNTLNIDAIIVAGDIFDTATPPSYARELYNRFVVDLQQTNCTLIILGGNHDSVATLEESRQLLACLNTRVVPGVMVADPMEQVFPLTDQHGEVAAILCAIPYIRPRDVITSKADQSIKDKQQSLQQGIAGHYASLYQQALSLQDSVSHPVPIIATGHLTTVGATTSESVREIYIGTLDAFPASAFPPADYIALGHIHKSQRVANSEHIRYSGSPIPLSFDEINQDKVVLLADFNDGKLSQVEEIVVPRSQPMAIVKGDLNTIEQQIHDLADNHQDKAPLWLDILVSTQDYLTDLQRRIQSMTQDLPVEVLLLRRDKQQQSDSLTSDTKETLAEINVEDVFERRLDQEEWPGETDQARRQRLRHCFAEAVSRSHDQIASENHQGLPESLHPDDANQSQAAGTDKEKGTAQ